MLLYPAMNQQPSVSLGWGIKKTFESIYPKNSLSTLSPPWNVAVPPNWSEIHCPTQTWCSSTWQVCLFTVFDPNTSSHFIFCFWCITWQKAAPVSFPFRCFLYKTQGSQAQVDNGLKHRCRSTKPAQQLMNDHRAPASPAWKVNYELSYLSKTRQRIVFGMIHRARIPDPTMGQS